MMMMKVWFLVHLLEGVMEVKACVNRDQRLGYSCMPEAVRSKRTSDQYENSGYLPCFRQVSSTTRYSFRCKKSRTFL